MAELQLGLVTLEDVPVIWPHVAYRIYRAIDRVGIIDFRMVENNVLSGRSWLWIAYDLSGIHAAATTEVTPDGVCEIVGCGGRNMKQFLPLIKQIEFNMKQYGCKAMRIIGRKGWSRVLPDYKFKALVIERQL